MKQKTESKTPEISLKPGQSMHIDAGEVKFFISRSVDHNDVHLYVEPKRPLFEIAIIPRTLKLLVIRAIQKVL